MLVYRIVHKSFSRKIIAPGFAGRWNGTGRKVVYCAESIALAFLENMIRRQGIGFNQDFKTMILEIPETLKMQSVLFKELPAGWRKLMTIPNASQSGISGTMKPCSPFSKCLLPCYPNLIITY